MRVRGALVVLFGAVILALSSPRIGTTASFDCTKTGTADAEVLRGTQGDDVLCGVGGDDELIGRGGGDILIGGAGDDTVRGGRGRDRVIGRAGDDRVLGGAGEDVLLGESGNDLLNGGPGDDQLIGGGGSNSCAGGGGEDTFSLSCDSEAPVLISVSASPAEFDTAAGAKTITITAGVADDRSDVGCVIPRLVGPSGQTVRSGCATPIAGQPGSRTYEQGLTLHQHAEQGVWKVGLELTDAAGNKRDLEDVARVTEGSHCSNTSIGLIPLNELGSGSYKDVEGGLYGDGSNVRPPAHEQAGLQLAQSIEPIDDLGALNPGSRYGFISIGPSLAFQEFGKFKELAHNDPAKDPGLVIVNGAQNSVTGDRWANPADSAWRTLDYRLTQAGVSRAQVAVAWVKLADADPTEGWPDHTRRLQTEIGKVLRLLHERFPNLRIAYLSSRVYAGYSTYQLSPEPYAYESAFAVRWVIGDQLGGAPDLNWSSAAGPVKAPWLSWGPYLWADGLTPRSDGLTWACGDFGDDGIHPAASGRRKVAELLMRFVHSDVTAREWYLAD